MADLNKFFETIEAENKSDFVFLKNTLPVTDWMDYSPELFLGFIKHAQMLRKTMPWCQEIGEDFYREYVLMPRINDEDLINVRPLFYEELLPRIQDLNDTDAVLEINRWCHEIGTYQQADPRTESPWAMYLSGSGRCGEESVFLVTALRSVGIPARQIYTPLWNHCDDNHAWVEAWCNGEWHFLGACEPEPILDRGWFNAAASRAVLIHSRRFTPAPEEENEEFSGTSGIVHYYNQTHRYAPVRRVSLEIVDAFDQPVFGAKVTLQLLNMACFHPISELITKEDGVITLHLGEGSFLVTAEKEGLYAEALCNEDGNICKTLKLQEEPKSLPWNTFSLHAAKASAVIPTLNDELKEKRTFIQKEGTSLREKRQEEFFLESQPFQYPDFEEILRKSGGNWGEIVQFISVDSRPIRKKILDLLEEKDYKDVTADVLNDHLAAEQFSTWFSEDIYDKYVLSPRIEWEKLTPWRSYFLSVLTEEDREKWRSNPEILWVFLRNSIDPIEGKIYPKVILSPESCWKYKKANERSCRILFVAILRTLGVPARLRHSDGIPEYWKDNTFVSVSTLETGVLCLKSSEKITEFSYDQTWSLSRYEDGFYRHLEKAEFSKDSSGVIQCELPTGNYRITLSTRLPNGNQECAFTDFSLESFSTFEIEPIELSFDLSEILADYPLPDYASFLKDSGKLVKNPHLKYNKWNLLCWLEEGAEPTEHVLNELLENESIVKELPIQIHFFLKNSDSVDQATLKKVLSQFPEIKVYIGNWFYDIDNMARAAYGNAETPPLIILCEPLNGKGVYSTSGYNVGTIPLISKIVKM